MNKICVGIYDEHKLVQQGIFHILKELNDVEVTFTSNNKMHLLNELKLRSIQILMINIHFFDIQIYNLINQININYPNVRILIISVHTEEDRILKTIKAGAKGFLSRDTDKNELIEAIYTLRNGYDYYSKSITHLLINKYITRLKSDDGFDSDNMKSLSTREVEILKLWGNSYTNKEIADKLFISVRTVESHKNHIMQKLKLKTTVDMVKFAIKNNIIEI